jgi:two-component system response regulator FixJ
MRLALLFDDPEVQEVLEAAQARASRRLERLTDRQRQVAVLMAEGLPNKTIAHRLELSPRSVENHRNEVMRRTGVSSLASLVRLVVLAG